MALTDMGFNTGVWSKQDLIALITQVFDGDGAISVQITAGTIDGAVIGGVTPAAGTFSTLTATNTVTLSPASHNVVLSPTGTGVVTINPATAGSMDKVNIGATTRGTGAFTTLAANGAVTFSNASLTLSAIPTADPHVAGQVWKNSGVLTVSAG